jgi:hypothetical protein
MPHTEAIDNPMTDPKKTATTGLHHMAQPAPPAAALSRYMPKPAAAPIPIPSAYFMLYHR